MDTGQHLYNLSDLNQQARITILLAEYSTLRAEIIARTGYGFQIATAILVTITWSIQQDVTNKSKSIWAILFLIFIALMVAIYVNQRDLRHASNRQRALEFEINSRAGERLLIWESTSANAGKSLLNTYFSGSRPKSEKGLPPLDPSYLERESAKREAVQLHVHEAPKNK